VQKCTELYVVNQSMALGRAVILEVERFKLEALKMSRIMILTNTCACYIN